MSLIRRRSKRVPGLEKIPVLRTGSVNPSELDMPSNEALSCPNSPAVKKMFRLVVVGSARTGKTSIVNRFLENEFEDRYLPTIENFHRKTYKNKGEIYQLDILDCSGIDPFPAARKLSYVTGEMFVLVCSVDHPESLNQISEIKNQIIECKNSRGLNTSHIPMIFVLNKIDLPRVKWNFNEAQFANLVKQNTNNPTGYILVSAAKNENIENLFSNIFLQARLPKFMSPNVHKQLRVKHSADGVSGEGGLAGSSRSHLLQLMRSKFSKDNDDESYTELNVRRSSLRTEILLSRAKSMEVRRKKSNNIGHKISIKTLGNGDPSYIVEACGMHESGMRKCVIM
uniref:GTP-binding protein Di-Ras2 n=1 Tax=Rhabditophanes sp. KR3021 TaxID=114890 RepID=A0AC35U776_9BILA